MREETLFHEALSKAPGERTALLERACAGQPQLRSAVEALLAAHEASRNLLDRPPVEPNQTIDSEPGPVWSELTEALEPGSEDAGRRAGCQVAAGAGAVIAGRYTLVEKIGEGGMGEVWVAQQTEPVKRRVALKLIKSGMDSSSVLSRFEQERQALALMDHPNIARVLDAGVTPSGQPFFVMELVNGLPLTKFCDEAKLPPRERLELFIPICQAVQHAHQKGIVHRDLKPANILVTVIDGKPVPKVIDFGVAKATGGSLTDESFATHFGAVVGTLEYMSPEQAGYSGVDVDTRADVYSLGVILYELLTGLRPLDSKRLQKAGLVEMIRVIQEVEPARPSTRLSTDEALPTLAATRQIDPRKLMALLRGELDWVVMKCLEKERARRYESASDLARDVQRYLADEPVEARPPSFGYRLQKTLRRNRGLVLGFLAVSLALLLGTGVSVWQAVRATSAEEEERKARTGAQALAEEKGRLADEKDKLARDESAAKALALEATREKDAQLQRARAILLTNQLERAVQLQEDDPAAALELLYDGDACPPELRDIAWSFVENACKRRHVGTLASLPGTHFWFSPDGSLLAGIEHQQPSDSPEESSRVVVVDIPSGKRRCQLPDFSSRVTEVAFSPDGRLLAVVADGALPTRKPGNVRRPVVPGRVQLFDLNEAKKIATLAGHTQGVTCLTFSRDGQLLATGSRDGSARIWDVKTATEKRVLKDHDKEVSALAFHPDGKRLATGGFDALTRLWNLETFQVEASWPATTNPDPQLAAIRKFPAGDLPNLQPSEDAVLALEFSADGTTLVSANANWLIESRDVASGQVRSTLREIKLPLQRMRLHRDGKSLIAMTRGARIVADNTPQVTQWDLATGRKLLTLSDRYPDAVGDFDPNRSLLARIGSLRTELLDLDAPLERANWATERTKALASTCVFNRSGDTLAVGCGQRIYLFDVRTAKVRHILEGHRNEIRQLALSPDGRMLASCCAMTPLANRPGTERPQVDDIRLWDSTTGAALGVLPMQKLRVSSIVFSPEGATLASLHWEPKPGEANRLQPVISLWDLKTRAVKFTLQPPAPRIGLLVDLATLQFNREDGTLVSCSEGYLCIWDLTTRSLRRQILAGRGNPFELSTFNSLAIRPDGKALVTTSTQGFQAQTEVTVWDPQTGTAMQKIRRKASGHLTFSSDGKNVLLTTPQTIEVWDALTMQRRVSIPIHERNGWIGMALSPDGQVLASCVLPSEHPVGNFLPDVPAQIKLWDVSRVAAKITITGPGPRQVEFSPDSKSLLEARSEGLPSRLWDLETGRVRVTFDTTKSRVGTVFSPDGRYLAGWETAAGKILLNLHDTTSGALRQSEVGAGQIQTLAFSPNGERVALVHATPSRTDPALGRCVTVELVNVRAGRAEQSIAVPEGYSGYSIAFTPDGSVLAVPGNSQAGTGVRRISLIDLDTARLLPPLEESIKPYPGNAQVWLSFTKDGTRLVAREGRATGKVWDWKAGKPVPESVPEQVVTAGLSPDERYETKVSPQMTEIIDRTAPVPVLPERRSRP